MAVKKPKQFNMERLSCKVSTYKLRKHTGVRVDLFLDKKECIYLLWFKPCTGYQSYAWVKVGQSLRYYCGKKKMMKDFLKNFKENYGR